MSKAVRELVNKGRLMLAVERYDLTGTFCTKWKEREST